MSSPCPVPGCTGHQQTGKLMCLPHWRAVSDTTQKEVYRTWSTLRAADPPVLRLAIRAYRAARDRAIAEAAGEQSLHDGGRLGEATKGLMP